VKAIVKPGKLKGEMEAPASKSSMQRACAAAFIRKGKTRLVNPGFSSDDKAALSIIKQMGAVVTIGDNSVEIDGGNFSTDIGSIDCGESGLSSRLFTSLAALSEKPVVIKGAGSLNKRPFDFFDKIMPSLGVLCKSDQGRLPLEIRGPLKPADITIDGSLSSQFLTGLLFAYAAAKAENVTITVENLKSKPYIDLTLSVMNAFNLTVPVNDRYTSFHFKSDNVSEDYDDEVLEFEVEGDWSGAAFLLVAGAINGNSLKVRGLDLLSLQSDRRILDALVSAGADMDLQDEQICISKSKLRSFELDATECPDLFPPLVALASFCKGESRIKGVHRLEYKESNRALTLQEEFGKIGVTIRFEDDTMVITPPREIKGGVTTSHDDHRIAMALAVAGVGAHGKIVIEGAEAVKKSYPYFWQHLQNVGGLVSLNEIDQ
jgi:3-phosphoshikimate 1-carboxyvinyltransferase